MRVIQCNTSDSGGGAAIAAYRLHHQLDLIGVHSTMLVQKKTHPDDTVIGPDKRYQDVINWYRQKSERALLKAIGYTDVNLWGSAWLPGGLKNRIDGIQPDLVHLHHVGGGLISIEGIGRITSPIVWTLHDMWAFTGGCFYDEECGKYRWKCSRCPILGSGRERDLSEWIWRRKSRSWKSIELTVVAPSRWLAESARRSALFRGAQIRTIPNGIDSEAFRPIEKQTAREILGLPRESKLLLFISLEGEIDTRKGYAYLRGALENIADKQNTRLFVVGGMKRNLQSEFGMRVHNLGRLNDEQSMALCYSAADLFVAPSIQDNLPNTVMEALSCGTPVVAFRVGGMGDMIDHQENGYLADRLTSEDLLRGIEWVLEDGKRCEKLGANARRKVEREFKIENIAKKYLALYEEIVRRN